MHRIRLDDNLNTNNNVLKACSIQNRLYIKTIWGYYNSFGIKVSKLILSLQALFPIKAKDLNLEFVTVKILNPSYTVSEFVFEFKGMHYFEFNGIMGIDWFINIEFPLFKLPKLSSCGTICVGDIQKTLISQFVMCQGVKVNNNCISLLTLNNNYLNVKMDGFKSSIEYLERVSNYISLMSILDVKILCILKNFACIKGLFIIKTNDIHMIIIPCLYI
ncbi:MAG: hypothetical protein ACKESA_01340 [Candidatus Hodgkinia cicadicola]